MKLKTFLTINAIVAIVVGLGFALQWRFWAEAFVSGYSLPAGQGFDAPMIKWLLASFVRMFGLMLLGLGALTMAVRDVSEKALCRKIVIALLLIWAFTTAMAWVQQIAIWRTSAGWVVVLWAALQAGGYAFYFFRGELDAWRPRPQPLNQADRDYNLELIRYVTQNYYNLQGLRIIPLGFWFLIFVTGSFGSSGAVNFFGIAGAIFAAVWWWWIGQYYRRTFGTVKASTNSTSWLLGGIALCILFFAASWLDFTWRLPFTSMWLVTGGMLLISWFFAIARRRVHYLVMGLLAIGFSFLFTFMTGLSLDNVAHAQFLGNFFNVFIGLMCVIAGWMDHLILMRAFKPLPEEVSHE